MNAAARQYAQPPKWTDEQLEERRREAMADFIAARSAEGSARYQAVFAARMHDAETLFSATDDLLDFASGRALANDPGLIEVARYLAAPPISGGDLNTLAEANVATRRKLDTDLGQKTALIIIAAGRLPILDHRHRLARRPRRRWPRASTEEAPSSAQIWFDLLHDDPARFRDSDIPRGPAARWGKLVARPTLTPTVDLLSTALADAGWRETGGLPYGSS